MSPSESETVEVARQRILDFTSARWESLQPRIDEFEAAVRREEAGRAELLVRELAAVERWASKMGYSRLLSDVRTVLAEYEMPVSASGVAE